MTTTRKYHGIRAAATETANASPYGGRVQIAYDPTDDRVLTHYSVSSSSWVEWAEGVIPVCTAQDKMTMAEIREAIERAIG